MKVRFLTGDCNWQTYGGKFITKKLNNGDWDYWLCIDFINMDEAVGQTSPKYVAQILAVSPKAAGWRNIKAALKCCGVRLKDFKNKNSIILEVLLDYGVYAALDSFSGNNYRRVLAKAKQALTPISNMFGFFMDGPKNRIGHTGWDYISGDLSLDKVINQTEHSPNLHVAI